MLCVLSVVWLRKGTASSFWINKIIIQVSKLHAKLHFNFNFRALIAGGGAPEIELALRLNEYSRVLSGMESYCVRGYGEALEIIPSTLAENAGLNPISTVTELRNRHAQGEKTAGINVRKVI